MRVLSVSTNASVSPWFYFTAMFWSCCLICSQLQTFECLRFYIQRGIPPPGQSWAVIHRSIFLHDSEVWGLLGLSFSGLSGGSLITNFIF